MMTNVAAQLTETFRQQRLPDDPNVTSTMYFTCFFFFQFSVKFNLWNVKDTSLDVGACDIGVKKIQSGRFVFFLEKTKT